MTLVLLAWEFFLIGLFSVGGGMATVPFLHALSLRYQWFSLEELTNIMAIGQSTPGPIGVNMAAYAGYLTAGLPGAFIAPLFLTLPAFFTILFLAKVISKLRGNPTFESIFHGLRPASVGLISVVLAGLFLSAFFLPGFVIRWKSVALFAAILLLMALPGTRKLPIPVFLLLAALAGVVFHMGA